MNFLPLLLAKALISLKNKQDVKEHEEVVMGYGWRCAIALISLNNKRDVKEHEEVVLRYGWRCWSRSLFTTFQLLERGTCF